MPVSVSSSTKLSCSRTALNHWISTDNRWNVKLPSRISPETALLYNVQGIPKFHTTKIAKHSFWRSTVSCIWSCIIRSSQLSHFHLELSNSIQNEQSLTANLQFNRYTAISSNSEYIYADSNRLILQLKIILLTDTL